jgi:phytanoyl-CoA hydroxylase
MPDHAFTPEELNAFRRDGFVIVRDLAAPEVRQSILHAAAADLAGAAQPVEYEAQLHYPGAPDSLEAPGGHTVRRLLQACARAPVFRQWATSLAVSARLHQLLGPELALAQAHHNCVMTKQPRFSSVTGWHQDLRYWSFQRPELVSVWLALGREHAENGCLSLIPGTHLVDFAADRLDPALFLREDLPQNRELISHRVTPMLEPGDVLFFHCRTLHAAGANRTAETKFSLVFTYHSADNLPLPGTRSASVPSIPVPR